MEFQWSVLLFLWQKLVRSRYFDIMSLVRWSVLWIRIYSPKQTLIIETYLVKKLWENSIRSFSKSEYSNYCLIHIKRVIYSELETNDIIATLKTNSNEKDDLTHYRAMTSKLPSFNGFIHFSVTRKQLIHVYRHRSDYN